LGEEDIVGEGVLDVYCWGEVWMVTFGWATDWAVDR
jgi:hypothetical protein